MLWPSSTVKRINREMGTVKWAPGNCHSLKKVRANLLLNIYRQMTDRQTGTVKLNSFEQSFFGGGIFN